MQEHKQHPARESTQPDNQPGTRQASDTVASPRPPQQGWTGRRIATGVMAVAAAGILGVLVWRERAALGEINLQNAWPALLIGFAIMLASLVIAAWIWGDIMRAMGSRVSMRRHMNIYATTYLARLLPGTIWFVVGRGMLYQEEGESARLSSVASGAEMTLMMMAGAVVTAVSGLALLTQGARALQTGPEAIGQNSLLGAAVAIGVVTLLCAVVLHPAVQRWVLRRLRLADTPPLRPRSAIKWLLLFCINWLVGAAIVYMNARVLWGGTSSLSLWWVIFAWSLVGTLSFLILFLPTNFGFSEIGLSLLLSAVMPSSVAVLVAVITRIVQVVYAAIACAMIAAATRPYASRSTPI